MTTDEEKTRTAKLLQGLEVPDMKLSDRCSDVIKDLHQKFDNEIEDEESVDVNEVYKNPYRVNPQLLEENERKLRELLSESKKAKKKCTENMLSGSDPKRPWRTHSNREKLLRIDCELKQHIEKSSQMIVPLDDDEMKDLVQECQQETLTAPPVSSDRLRDTVEAARKNLINFQYRKVENSTATVIFPNAHELETSTKEQNLSVN